MGSSHQGINYCFLWLVFMAGALAMKAVIFSIPALSCNDRDMAVEMGSCIYAVAALLIYERYCRGKCRRELPRIPVPLTTM